MFHKHCCINITALNKLTFQLPKKKRPREIRKEKDEKEAIGSSLSLEHVSKAFLYGLLLKMMKSDKHNYKTYSMTYILLNQPGIKTAFYRNTERNNSWNNKHDDQKLLYPF